MKIATWNVNGIRARQAQFMEWLEHERPDIVCLQEIKAKPEQLAEDLCELSGHWCYWHGAGGYSGVGLHVRREFLTVRPEFSHPPFDLETRVVQVKIGNLIVASVYVPNGGKDYAAKIDFMRALERWAASIRAAGQELVICGDLNVALTDDDVHPKERKPNIIGQTPEERELLANIIAHDLVDVQRATYPDDKDLFTWWAPWRNMRQRNIGWRIDYILASRRVAETVRTAPVYREVGTSDHAPIVATFDYLPEGAQQS